MNKKNSNNSNNSKTIMLAPNASEASRKNGELGV